MFILLYRKHSKNDINIEISFNNINTQKQYYSKFYL